MSEETKETTTSETTETTEQTDTSTETERTFTQADVDRVVQQRLARAQKQWESEAEERRKREQMTETERLQAEVEAARQQAEQAQTAANERLIQAAAQVAAVGLGIRSERVGHALRLADLSEVEVGENGEPDVAAIRAALEAVVKDLPELKGGQGPSKSGGEFKGGNTGDKNPWAKDSFNLTEQGRIYRENPELARRLMKEAKG